MDFVMGWGVFIVGSNGPGSRPTAWCEREQDAQAVKAKMDSGIVQRVEVRPCALEGRFAFDHEGL